MLHLTKFKHVLYTGYHTYGHFQTVIGAPQKHIYPRALTIFLYSFRPGICNVFKIPFNCGTNKTYKMHHGGKQYDLKKVEDGQLFI